MLHPSGEAGAGAGAEEVGEAGAPRLARDCLRPRDNPATRPPAHRRPAAPPHGRASVDPFRACGLKLTDLPRRWKIAALSATPDIHDLPIQLHHVSADQLPAVLPLHRRPASPAEALPQ